MTINQSGIAITPGSGQSYWVLGDLYTFKAVGEETGQAYALLELLIQPQSGTPPHRHTLENESFYILDGEIEFQLDEQVILATPETFLHSPKGQKHSFINRGSTPAKMLLWLTPAGLEKFFAEVGTPVSEAVNVSPSVNPEDLEKILTAAPKYGLEVIPPQS